MYVPVDGENKFLLPCQFPPIRSIVVNIWQYFGIGRVVLRGWITWDAKYRSRFAKLVTVIQQLGSDM